MPRVAAKPVQVILLGKDWKSRALLRAQLIEEGLEVKAYDSVADAIEAAAGHNGPAPLLIADLAGSDDPALVAAQLAHWSRRIPIWIVASRSVIDARELEGRGFEAVLYRPVDVGDLVERIKRCVGGVTRGV